MTINRREDHYNWKGGRTYDPKGYVRILMPEHPRSNVKGYVMEHIVVCEKALGKPLPKGAVPHHVNEKKDDNRPHNLVICEDENYHKLLHARMRAYKACGNPNARKCTFCKEWEVGLLRNQNHHYHKKCRSEYAIRKWRERRDAKKKQTPVEGE